MANGKSTSSPSTEELIRHLAGEAGRPPAHRLVFASVLAAVLPVSMLAALGMVLMLVGPRPDLAAILPTWIFQFKAAGMLLVGAGGLAAVVASGRPGATGRPALFLLPAVLFLFGCAMFGRNGYPLLGAHTYSVPVCVGIIVAASMPPLFAILLAMRTGTPTDLVRAGVSAGVLAGAFGALAYTVACINDGTGFVALWYGLAIAIVGAIGALAGRTALAW